MIVFKSQHVSTGANTDYTYGFPVVQNRTVRVFVTKEGVAPDEVTDLQNPASYVVTPENPTAPESTGTIRFNTPPAINSTITIVPDQGTGVTYLFSNTIAFDQNNLNSAYAQQSTTIGGIQYNQSSNALRYNENERESDINYSNIIPPLPDGAFWRRVGGEIISQGFTEFVEIVEAAVSEDVNDKVLATDTNTVLNADISSNQPGVMYSGTIKTVDSGGNVIDGQTLTGFSAFAAAHWSRLWATSTQMFTDDFGNTGLGARFYAEQARTAATSQGGVIDELRVFSTSTTTSVQLVSYDENGVAVEPWKNVLQNSFSVYVAGVRLTDPVSYSAAGTPAKTGTTYIVTIVSTEDLSISNPSSITFTPAVPANTEIYIARSEAQGTSSSMFSDGSNFLSDTSSKIADRNLSNYQPIDTSLVLTRTLSNLQSQTTTLPYNFNAQKLTGRYYIDSPDGTMLTNHPMGFSGQGVLVVERITATVLRQTLEDISTSKTYTRTFTEEGVFAHWTQSGNAEVGLLDYFALENAPAGWIGITTTLQRNITNGRIRYPALWKVTPTAAGGWTQRHADGITLIVAGFNDFIRSKGGSIRGLGVSQSWGMPNIFGRTFSVFQAQEGVISFSSSTATIGGFGTSPTFLNNINLKNNPTGIGWGENGANGINYFVHNGDHVTGRTEISVNNKTALLCIYHGNFDQGA